MLDDGLSMPLVSNTYGTTRKKYLAPVSNLKTFVVLLEMYVLVAETTHSSSFGVFCSISYLTSDELEAFHERMTYPALTRVAVGTPGAAGGSLTGALHGAAAGPGAETNFNFC